MFSLFLTSHHPAICAFLDLCFGWIIVYTARMAWRHFHVSSLLKHVPGPTAPSFLWGSEWEMHQGKPGARYMEWKQRYGGVVKFKGAFGRNMLAISDHRAATYILGEHVFDFPKPKGPREWFRLLVGEGLLVVEGKEAHARQRKTFSPALNPQAIRPLLTTFYETSSRVANAWASKIDTATGDTIEEDIQHWANLFSLDTVGLAGFSYDFASLSGIINPLAAALDALTNTADNFMSFVMKALFWSFPAILSIPSEKGRSIRNTREELGKVATRMWSEAKAAGDEGGGKTLMSSMMKADREAGKNGMSEEEIAAQLRTLVQAGYETVSCAIAWVLYELAQHPDIQERVRQEVSATPAEPDYDDLLEQVPLLDAVLKESLRLHPPVLELHHISAKDNVVPLSEPLPGTTEMQLVIPRGTIIAIPVNVMQTDPEVWGPDAAEFRPERWLEMEQEKKAEHVNVTRELMAFSYGPRKCIGRNFATMEIKALAVTILRQFSLSTIPEKPIESFWSFVVRARVQGQKSSTLPLRISKIKY